MDDKPSEEDAKHILFILFVDNKNGENKNNCSDILKAELHTWYPSEEKQTSVVSFACPFLAFFVVIVFVFD